jgi:putative transposase
MNRAARLLLVDRADADLSIVAQCRLLKVARSSLYWHPAAVSEDDLRLMRRIDELYLARPFYGTRRMVAALRREDGSVNRKRVRRLMGIMRIEAIYQKPNTSRRHPDHVVYPYLLRCLVIDRAEPGVVRRHHVHSAREGVRVSGRGDGLVQPPGSGLAFVDRLGRRILCRGLAGSAGSIRFA